MQRLFCCCWGCSGFQMGGKTSKTNLSPKSLEELRNDVDFTAEEIKEWYKEYRSSLKNGMEELTKDEFKKVYNSLFAGDASDFAEHVFRTFDLDRSGTVNFKEFLIGLCVSGSDEADVKLKWAFNMYDINGDGNISRSEMSCIVGAIFKMTQARVPPEIDTPEKMTDRFFTQMDLDNDGHISWDEFRKGAKHDSVIVHLLECDPEPDP